MEFILGNQRIFIDEDLHLRKTKMNQESEYRRWVEQNEFALTTSNIYETLLIKFYNMNESNGSLELIGSEMVELSALYLQYITDEIKKVREANARIQEEKRIKGSL